MEVLKTVGIQQKGGDVVKIPLLVWMIIFRALPALSCEVISLRLVPGEITLRGNNSSRRFLVLARCSDGLQRDITDSAQLTVSPPVAGDVDKSGTFIGKSNGKATLKAEYRGKAASASVQVDGVGENRPFSFPTNIGAILTKRGCNDSECHGGVKGKGGLKLSASANFPVTTTNGLSKAARSRS